MSKPWRPNEDVVRVRFGAGKRLRLPDEFKTPDFVGRMQHVQRRLPEGAKAGLVLVAAACVGVAIGVYQVAGPRDVFERNPATDWNAVDDAARR